MLRKKSLSTADVRSIIKPYNNLVFSNLDKNENGWIITCPKLHIKMYHDHFDIQNSNVYKKSCLSQQQIQKQIKLKFQELDIAGIAQPKKDNKMNHAYLLRKQKNIDDFRPVVSFYEFIAKPAGKRISRALNVIIQDLDKVWTTMNITKTTDFYTKMKAINRTKKWLQHIKDEEITFFEMDVSKQYTDLDRNEVTNSLQHGLRALTRKFSKSNVSIARKVLHKASDGLGLKPNKRFHHISFNQILNYAKFELSTSFFKVGKTMVEQTNGLPMGALISSQLAVIDSMFKENENKHKWRHLRFQQNVKSQAFRFRDDIRVIIGKRLNYHQKVEFHNQIQSIYGNHLNIKLERVSHTSINFVGTSVFALRDRFVILDNNTNFNLSNDMSKMQIHYKKNRYPDTISEWPSSVLRAITYTAILQIHRKVSESGAFLMSFMPIVYELLKKGYRHKWIYDSVIKLNLPYQNLAIQVLHILKGLF